ncbi:MAG: ankyrin repeat domain-containing protein [Pseudomonadota bacterium]
MNKKHETFLVLAAKKGYTDICKKVLRFMNDNIYDFSGKLLGEKSYENQCYLAFLAASKFGHYEVIEFFLSKVDLELLLKDKYSGDTALTVACRENHTRVARLLYGHGADPKEENKIGESPYLLACAHRNVDLIALLFSDCQELSREEIREVVLNVSNQSNSGERSNASLLELGNNFLTKIDHAINKRLRNEVDNSDDNNDILKKNYHAIKKGLRNKSDHSDDQVCFKSLAFEKYCRYLGDKKIDALKFEDYIKEFPRHAKKFYELNRGNETGENKRQLMYYAFKYIQKAIASLAEKLDHLVDPIKHSFCLLWGDELLDSLKGELEKILNLKSMVEIYKLFLFSDDYKPRLLLQIKNIAELQKEWEKVSSSNASSEVADNGNLLFHQKKASKKRARRECAPVA